MIGVGLFPERNSNYRARVGMQADLRPEGFVVASGEVTNVRRAEFTVLITFTVNDVYKRDRYYVIKMSDPHWRVVRGDA